MGRALFDVASRHVDRVVEDAVDEVDIEYLDRLVELTGDDFMGEHEIDAETVQALTPA